MRLRFTKMQGLGNDFVVVDAIAQQVRLTPEQIRFIADRHFGIGCDQVLLIEAAKEPGSDFHYRIFNQDGGEVEQCGNGARCFAHFVRARGLTSKKTIDVSTRSGRIRLFIEDNGDVRVNMGIPVTSPGEIPFEAAAEAARYPIEVEGERLQIGAVSMGNPHAVLQVDDIAAAPVARLGPLLEHHPRFPRRVNVGFMQVCSPGHIRLRVFERGAGETLACGTGACAAVVSGRLQGLLESRVRVSLSGGDLMVEWQGGEAPVWMSGPAACVYEGSIEL